MARRYMLEWNQLVTIMVFDEDRKFKIADMKMQSALLTFLRTREARLLDGRYSMTTDLKIRP